MKIRKINDTTINCIITQDDLKEKGINLSDLFDRKKEAVAFIREIVAKAVKTANFQAQSEYTSMRLSILPDKSVSLTISQDPSESQRITSAAEGLQNPGQFIFEFHSIGDMIPACRQIRGTKGLISDVYQLPGEDRYCLVLKRGEAAGAEFEASVLRVNEFAGIRRSDHGTIQYLREHAKLIAGNNAAELLSSLDDAVTDLSHDGSEAQ